MTASDQMPDAPSAVPATEVTTTESDTPSPARSRLAVVLRALATHIPTALLTFGLTAAVKTANLAGSGQFVRDFVTSAGFGGLAALGAATLAFFGIRFQAQGQAKIAGEALKHQQQADEADRWWSTFQWTADRSFPADKDAIPLPPAIAIDTLRELAVTSTNNAQKIACGGLVDELAPQDRHIDATSDRSDGVGAKATSNEYDDEKLSAALSRYEIATKGSPAESAILRRRAYESEVRSTLARIAEEVGVDYESSALLGIFGRPDLEERYLADGAISKNGKTTALIEVVAFERAGARIVERLRSIAQNPSFPVMFVSRDPLPSFLADLVIDDSLWVRWSPGDDPTILRQALLDLAHRMTPET